MPLLAFHYVGSGSVMIQGFDESWRWRWRVGDLFLAVTGSKRSVF